MKGLCHAEGGLREELVHLQALLLRMARSVGKERKGKGREEKAKREGRKAGREKRRKAGRKKGWDKKKKRKRN